MEDRELQLLKAKALQFSQFGTSPEELIVALQQAGYFVSTIAPGIQVQTKPDFTEAKNEIESIQSTLDGMKTPILKTDVKAVIARLGALNETLV